MKKAIIIHSLLVIHVCQRIMKISRDPIKFDIENKSFIDYQKTNPFTTEISLGTPPQKLKMNINFLSYSYYVAARKFSDNPNIIPFFPNNSTTLNYDETQTDFLDAELDLAYYAYDTFKFGDFYFKEFPIVLATKLSYRTKLFKNSGIVGLAPDKLPSSQYNTPNFLEQLKNKQFLNTKNFFIEFENDNQANIIMGISPSNYSSSKYGNCTHRSKAVTDLGVLSWGVMLDHLYYGNISLKNEINSKIIFDLDQIFISTSQHPLNDTVYQNFFKPLIEQKLCEIVDVPKDHQYYICDEHIDLNQFKDINFYNKEISFNFTFKANDLFIKAQNKLIFGIRFKNYVIEFRKWVFGSVFLKKYKLEFDLDSKTVGFYLSEPHVPDVPVNHKFRLIIILSALFLLTLSALISVSWCLYKLKKSTRKKRATEISDDYEYSEFNKNESLLHN